MVDLHEQWTYLPWEKPRSRHWVAAAFAVFLSLGFHAAVIHYFPPVPVGRTARLDESSRRISPLVLRDVQREPMAASDRPRRFESPAEALAAAPQLDADALRDWVAEWVPPAVTDMIVPLRGDEMAARPPSDLPEREVWDARQDIVQIRDRIVPDDMALLPRRVIHDVDRVGLAPDISPAADSLAVSQAARGAEWLQSRAAAGAGFSTGIPPLAGDADEADDEGEEEGDRIVTPVMERTDPLAERAADISDMAPIEELLQLSAETFRDPADPLHTYFRLSIERAGPDVLPVLAKDVLLIQDASASMTQRTIDQSKEGMRSWLDVLSSEDRFNIIAFRDDVSQAFDALTPASPHHVLRAQTFIETLRARSGTDVFASLQPLLEIEHVEGRPVIAVLISDGIPTVGMVSSTQILQSFSEANAGRVAMFTIGGGPQVNEYLLDFLSYKNRGDSIMTWDRDQIPVAMARLAQELRRPVLTDLQHQIVAADAIELYPQLLTHLFLDRPLVMYGRKPVDRESMVIRILGQSGTDRKDMVFPVSFMDARDGDESIRTEWAWQKVYHLIGEHIRSRDPVVLTRIRQLAAAYGLNVLYGDDRIPMTFQRRFRFHGQQAE